MGMAHLNVWVTEVGNPCRIDAGEKTFVHVLHCDGTVLEWCDEPKWNLQAKCGHVEVDVPPGCYMVCSTQGEGSAEGKLGNDLSHVAVVRVNCGDHACVTLFQPSVGHCGVWWNIALRDHVARGLELPEGALDAVEAIVEALPRDELTENMMVLAGDRPKPQRPKR